MSAVQFVSGTPEQEASKVTNWNFTPKAVTLAYFQAKVDFFGNWFPKKQSDKNRVTSNPKRTEKKSAYHVTLFCTCQSG